ncbi:MAG: hypothetical protein Q8K65_07520 [Alphaproteobacteria bacterium]|nr:hypothetical protein [Alphaproteobacteria bacterium]
MKKLTPEQIRDEFNARKEKFSQWGEETGFNAALQGISTALADLRAGGIDVSLEILGDSSQQAFALRPDVSVTSPISGVLRINHIHRLFSITVRESDKPCLKVSLSDFDIRYQGAHGEIKEGKLRNVIRTKTYDFKKDPDALVKFQQEIIQFSARNAVVAENDVANAFDTGISTKKPALKSALKKPANG